MRNLILIIASTYVLILGAGCAAGPLGPPLGLGPELDPLVLWGLVVLAALFLWPRAQRYFRKQCGSSGSNSFDAGMKTVAERYAKGEINRDEYLKMLDDLRQGIVQ